MSGLYFGFAPDDVLVITGAGSGIGRATAVEAARQGLRVGVWDRDPRGVEQTLAAVDAAAGPGRARGQVADVTQPAEVTAALLETVRDWGIPRHLANNAGPSSADDVPFTAALEASVGSVARVTDAWAALGVPDGASMVTTASVAGNRIGTESAWYSAAKAALAGYVRHLASQRAQEFRSNAVAPGMVDTPRLAGWAESETGRRTLARNPLRRMAHADEIARAILFLLSPAASYVNGEILVVDGGWTVTQ